MESNSDIIYLVDECGPITGEDQNLLIDDETWLLDTPVLMQGYMEPTIAIKSDGHKTHLKPNLEILINKYKKIKETSTHPSSSDVITTELAPKRLERFKTQVIKHSLSQEDSPPLNNDLDQMPPNTFPNKYALSLSSIESPPIRNGSVSSEQSRSLLLDSEEPPMFTSLDDFPSINSENSNNILNETFVTDASPSSSKSIVSNLNRKTCEPLNIMDSTFTTETNGYEISTNLMTTNTMTTNNIKGDFDDDLLSTNKFIQLNNNLFTNNITSPNLKNKDSVLNIEKPKLKKQDTFEIKDEEISETNNNENSKNDTETFFNKSTNQFNTMIINNSLEHKAVFEKNILEPCNGENEINEEFKYQTMVLKKKNNMLSNDKHEKYNTIVLNKKNRMKLESTKTFDISDNPYQTMIITQDYQHELEETETEAPSIINQNEIEDETVISNVNLVEDLQENGDSTLSKYSTILLKHKNNNLNNCDETTTLSSLKKQGSFVIESPRTNHVEQKESTMSIQRKNSFVVSSPVNNFTKQRSFVIESSNINDNGNVGSTNMFESFVITRGVPIESESSDVQTPKDNYVESQYKDSPSKLKKNTMNTSYTLIKQSDDAMNASYALLNNDDDSRTKYNRSHPKKEANLLNKSFTVIENGNFNRILNETNGLNTSFTVHNNSNEVTTIENDIRKNNSSESLEEENGLDDFEMDEYKMNESYVVEKPFENMNESYVVEKTIVENKEDNSNETNVNSTYLTLTKPKKQINTNITKPRLSKLQTYQNSGILKKSNLKYNNQSIGANVNTTFIQDNSSNNLNETVTINSNINNASNRYATITRPKSKLSYVGQKPVSQTLSNQSKNTNSRLGYTQNKTVSSNYNTQLKVGTRQSNMSTNISFNKLKSCSSNESVQSNESYIISKPSNTSTFNNKKSIYKSMGALNALPVQKASNDIHKCQSTESLALRSTSNCATSGIPQRPVSGLLKPGFSKIPGPPSRLPGPRSYFKSK